MKRFGLIVCLGFLVTLVLVGCGESVNYEQVKEQTGDSTKEYRLHVSGMT